VKVQVYTTLVRPVLDYASTVWDPYTLQQIYALERVQRQSARFVTGDYSSRDPGNVTRMLQQLQWDTLEERRARSRSIMLYRILNNLVEVPLHQYIQINTIRTRGFCAHNILQISTRVDAYKYSFLPRTIVTWNFLSPELRSQPTVESFRHHIFTISMQHVNRTSCF
jgi:hypothetical protein